MIKDIYEVLYKNFKPLGWWPLYNKKTDEIEYHPKTYIIKSEQKRFEIIMGAILAQSTSWKNAEKSIKILYNKSFLNKKSLERINIRTLAGLIISSGYHNQKAKKIKEFIKFINSKKPVTRENLLNVWGVGPETADSILLYAYNKPIFVIDAYTKRVFNRLGLSRINAGYAELQDLFMKNLPSNYKVFNEYHALIVKLAKEYCKNDPLCNKCPISRQCDYGKPKLNI